MIKQEGVVEFNAEATAGYNGTSIYNILEGSDNQLTGDFNTTVTGVASLTFYCNGDILVFQGGQNNKVQSYKDLQKTINTQKKTSESNLNYFF